ncbi:RHS repeat protein [Lysobacter sp. A6]|uniref:RHS repeat protein n=1 Tax=Noviluteimonas lactosilytica TaxID=2888523 RepID=A0ABS8JGW2_9GAMM|nr:RHS repeat-associated core domain-containing protein [Lysobacter lactosilyticus]MCC8362745.1 RHS repeat protein [Lysobacter lactosilyticus]
MSANLLLVAAFVATQVTSYEYDELGRLIAERSGAEKKLVARYAYDADGRRTEVTNGKGETTRLTYDALGRVATSTDPMGGVTKFTYDPADRVTSVTDPRGLVTTYKYNGFGDLLELDSPDTGKTTHVYSPEGLRERTTRNDGSTLVFDYDGAGRVTKVTGGADQRTFAYDTCGAGFLCEAKTLRSGVLQAATRFTFTPYGQMLTRVDTAQGVEDTTRYQYDAFGRLAMLTYPGGLSVGYGYTLGRITSMTASHGGTTQTVLSDVRYRPFGGPESWTYGNGLQRRYDVDDNGRLFGISATDMTAGKVKQSLTYGFDGADRINAITNGAGPPTTQTFGYDANGRLASDAISQQSGHALAFDANGNRTRHTWGGGTEQHAIDPHSNRLLAISGTSNPARHHVYDYDLRGNRISDTTSGVTTQFAYDAFNRIKQVSRPKDVEVCEQYGTCRTLEAGTTTYAVNALDQRVAKSGLSGATRFVFGDQTRLLAEHGTSGWTHYVWFGGELVSMLTPSNSTILTWYEDLPITLSHPGLKYVHNDHLGRPEVVTSGYKVDLWRARNYAFDRNVSLDLIGGLNLGFSGQHYDAESDLWSNGFRTLDLKAGRYTQPDPLGMVAGVNPYAYVEGNPVNAIDPLGLETCLLTTIGPGGIRDHAAIYTSRGDGGGPALYDPAGSFAAANGGGSGEIVVGEAASKAAFAAHHRSQTVESTCKDTSAAEESRIINRAMQLADTYGITPAGDCAIRSSDVLNGLPSFPNVESGTFWPGNLLRQIKGP